MVYSVGQGTYTPKKISSSICSYLGVNVILKNLWHEEHQIDLTIGSLCHLKKVFYKNAFVS